jgi:hypothetical protein
MEIKKILLFIPTCREIGGFINLTKQRVAVLGSLKYKDQVDAIWPELQKQHKARNKAFEELKKERNKVRKNDESRAKTK